MLEGRTAGDLLVLRDLSKSFGGRGGEAVRGVSLGVRRGEVSPLSRGPGCPGSARPPGSEVTADRPAAGSTRETAPPGGRVILSPLHSLCDGALVSAGL